MRRFLIAIVACFAVATATHAQTAQTAHTTTPVPAAPVQSGTLLSGVDVMSSTVLQEGQSSFAGLAARARIHPASFVEGLEILPSIEYWRNASTVSPYAIHASRKDATIGADMRYMFKVGTWNPYVGAGYAVHFLSSHVDAPAFGLNNASDSVVKGGLAALGGTSFEITPRIGSFIELKYHHIPDYRQLKINWGLSFNL